MSPDPIRLNAGELFCYIGNKQRGEIVQKVVFFCDISIYRGESPDHGIDRAQRLRQHSLWVTWHPLKKTSLDFIELEKRTAHLQRGKYRLYLPNIWVYQIILFHRFQKKTNH